MNFDPGVGPRLLAKRCRLHQPGLALRRPSTQRETHSGATLPAPPGELRAHPRRTGEALISAFSLLDEVHHTALSQHRFRPIPHWANAASSQFGLSRSDLSTSVKARPVFVSCVLLCCVVCCACVRCVVGPPGLAHDSPRTPNVHISGPRRFKLHQNSTKGPPRGKNERKLWREREKKREILGPPPFGAPPFRAPPFLAPPSPRGPTLRGPTFLSLGPSLFGAPPFFALPLGAPPFGPHSRDRQPHQEHHPHPEHTHTEHPSPAGPPPPRSNKHMG